MSKEEYDLLASYPPKERIIQVGDKDYIVTHLERKYLKAVPYYHINIIGKFREERDNQFKENLEYSNSK